MGNTKRLVFSPKEASLLLHHPIAYFKHTFHTTKCFYTISDFWHIFYSEDKVALCHNETATFKVICIDPAKTLEVFIETLQQLIELDEERICDLMEEALSSRVPKVVSWLIDTFGQKYDLLTIACERGDYDVVQSLVEKTENRFEYVNNVEALEVLAEHGFVNTLEYLHLQGADLKFLYRYFHTYSEHTIKTIKKLTESKKC